MLAWRDGHVCAALIEAAACVMTTASHPYLKAEQFADPMFLRVRRQVALLRLPYAEGELAEMLWRTIEIYDDLLTDNGSVKNGGRRNHDRTDRCQRS